MVRKTSDKNYESSKKNYVRTFAIAGTILATLVSGIIKGPDYINSLNPNYHEKSLELLSDSTFQGYLQQRADAAEEFLKSSDVDYSPRKLKKHLDAIFGRNPLE